MMDSNQLATKMLVCSRTIKDLLSKISTLEEDNQMPVEEKYQQIKKIRQELAKISSEIDTIKQGIKLLHNYNIN